MTGKRARSDTFELAGGSPPPKKRLVTPSRHQPSAPSQATGQDYASLPLTRENLLRFQQGSQPSRTKLSLTPSRTSSPSKSQVSTIDLRDKLRFYNIYIDINEPLPRELQTLVDDTIKKPRGYASPAAQRIASNQRKASLMAEQDGIDLLKDLLHIKADDEQSVIDLKAKMNLSKDFVPSPPDPLTSRTYGPIEQPQPDHAIGYLTSANARVDKVSSAFSPSEELIFSRFTLNTQLYFPFFTTQWKSQKNFQTHYQARGQGARDGATIVNYLYQFFARARDRKPTVVETCHFSATCDLETCQLYIHWRQEKSENDIPEVEYHMEPIAMVFLRQTEQMMLVRKIMRNIFEYATQERLRNIKEAVGLLGVQNRNEGPARRSTALLSLPTPSFEGSAAAEQEPKKRKGVPS